MRRPGSDAFPVERPFGVRRRERAAGEITLELSGEFDLTSLESFEEAAAGIPAGTHVTIDLSALDFIDSSGLRSFMNLDLRVRAHDGRLTLRAPPPHADRLLRLCGFHERFEILPA